MRTGQYFTATSCSKFFQKLPQNSLKVAQSRSIFLKSGSKVALYVKLKVPVVKN